MRDRRKRNVVSWSTFFWYTVLVVFSSIIFTAFTLSTLRQRESFHANVELQWRAPAMEAKSGGTPVTPAITIREAVELPDQILIFLNYPPSFLLLTKKHLNCVYFLTGSSRREPPFQIDQTLPNEQMVRCTRPPGSYKVSLAVKSSGRIITSPPVHKWKLLVYEAMIDYDDTTIVFVKGLNLHSAKLDKPSKYECVYGWDFMERGFLLPANVISVAQEIVRCRTPQSILSGQHMESVKVSIRVKSRVKNRGIFPSIARPGLRPKGPKPQKAHNICVCTMLRNQAQFMKEWVMYHARIGVQRWFIYDNNSDDDIDIVIKSLQSANYNITKHVWPWVKTQEAGFAHCALRARDVCQWVGFIDVDEFFHLKSAQDLNDIIEAHSGYGNVGELRISCYSFGPSGLTKVPRQGVMAGYTCRLSARERHKSIIRPDALNSSLINVVHHFHLRYGFEYVDVNTSVIVINHYKYQVWKVFKQKFKRRVATYVADWKQKQNIGSNDRAPGLGTQPVEPTNWSKKFCEVRDEGLRDFVVGKFEDRRTHLLPWHPEYEQRRREYEQRRQEYEQKRRRRRRKRRESGFL